jgi:hypothetical protein
MKQRATGTAERRNRLKPADLLEIEIGVPSRHAQVAVGSLMSQIDLVRTEGGAAQSVATALAAKLLACT